MKKVKIVLWLLVIGFVALVIYQNQDYFLAKTNSLDINLYVRHYQVPEFANGALILGCFLLGFFLAFVMSLSDKFKARKVIRNLNATVESHLEQISVLRGEVEALKRDTPAVQQVAGEFQRSEGE
jgi:hypothetical protein